jgi:hypothetical protein
MTVYTTAQQSEDRQRIFAARTAEMYELLNRLATNPREAWRVAQDAGDLVNEIKNELRAAEIANREEL